MKKPAANASKPVREIVEGPFGNADLLPARVAAMREKILDACASGEIDQLRPAIERNEVIPLFGKAGDRPKNFATAIEFLRTRAFDGKGRETLLLLEAVFTAPFVKVTRGPHVSYLWPSFAVLPLNEPDAEQKIARLRCVAFSDISRLAIAGDALIQRAIIGEDGTWHAFGLS